MILSAPLFHFPDVLLNKIKLDIRHKSAWNGRLVNANIQIHENVVCRAPYFHAKSTTKMIAPTAFTGLNASNGGLVVDLAESVLSGDVLSPTHDGKANICIILKNRLKIRCKLACKVVHTLIIFDFNSPF